MAPTEYDHDAAVKKAAERIRREDADQILAIHARRDEFAHQYAAEQERQLRRDRADIEAANERRARAQSQADAIARAQLQWADEKRALEAKVATNRGLLTSARGNVESADLAEARTAASDVTIYEQRLAGAERTLAAHIRNQPAGW